MKITDRVPASVSLSRGTPRDQYAGDAYPHWRQETAPAASAKAPPEHRHADCRKGDPPAEPRRVDRSGYRRDPDHEWPAHF